MIELTDEDLKSQIEKCKEIINENIGIMKFCQFLLTRTPALEIPVPSTNGKSEQH